MLRRFLLLVPLLFALLSRGAGAPGLSKAGLSTTLDQGSSFVETGNAMWKRIGSLAPGGGVPAVQATEDVRKKALLPGFLHLLTAIKVVFSLAPLSCSFDSFLKSNGC